MPVERDTLPKPTLAKMAAVQCKYNSTWRLRSVPRILVRIKWCRLAQCRCLRRNGSCVANESSAPIHRELLTSAFHL